MFYVLMFLMLLDTVRQINYIFYVISSVKSACYFSSLVRVVTLMLRSFNVKSTWFNSRVCLALLTTDVNFTVSLSAGYITMQDGVNK